MSTRQKYQYPVVYFESNLVFTRGHKSLLNISGKECWACYKVTGFTYDFLSNSEKISQLIKNSRAFQQVYQEAHLLKVPVQSKVSDNANYLRGLASGDMKPLALQYIEASEEILSAGAEEKQSNDDETFFLVKLKKPRTLKDYKDVLLSFVREPYRTVNELIGLDITEIYKNEFESYKLLERNLKHNIKRYMNIREINELDIEKLIRSPFWRGLQQPPTRGRDTHYDPLTREYRKGKPWKPACQKIQVGDELILRPLKRDILTLCEGRIENKHKHIEIYHDYKGKELVSYQKFIAVSGLPDIDFPESGREWIYNLNSLNFPIWVSVRYVKKEYQEVAGEINKKRKELDDQLEHTREAGAKLSQQYSEQDEEIDSAKYEVESEKKPFLYSSIIIAVASDNLMECNKCAKDVQDFFDDYDIETQVPTGDQWKLFCEMLIGGKQYVPDYILRIPPETLAGSMIGASTLIGDPLGLHIGTTGIIQKPVRFDPTRAPQINASPSVTFTGGLGRGKSTLANLIALLAAYLGAKVLINDPKGDRGQWSEVIPEIKPYLNMIELSPDPGNAGKLDIFQVMLKSLGANASKAQKKMIAKQAAEYALSILGTLAGYKTTDDRMELMADAVTLVAQSDNPCMMGVINALEKLSEETVSEERESFKRLAKTLRNRINNTAYAHLLFGTGKEEVIDITKPINILQTQNLIIPEQGKPEEEFTFQERVGMATLICTSAIGMQFALQSREYLKIYMQDESSVFKRSAQGKAMFNRMVKMGRSENAPVYLIGQNISDVAESEDISANIGTRFCFGTNSMGEAKNILRYLGLDENNIELQKMLVEDFPTGICFMKDIEGRISIIGVDLLMEKFEKAFDTKPKLRTGDDSEQAIITARDRLEKADKASTHPSVKEESNPCNKEQDPLENWGR